VTGPSDFTDVATQFVSTQSPILPVARIRRVGGFVTEGDSRGGKVAELSIDGDELVLSLTRAERIEGVHGDLRVARSAVRSVEVLDDAHRAADMIGLKIGSRIPGVIEVATVHGATKTIFAVVHRDTPRGVRIVLDGAAQDEWIVGCADPESVAESLTRRG